MRWIKFTISLLGTLLFVWIIACPWGVITFRPAAFLSPFEGFWRNGVVKEDKQNEWKLKGVKGAVEVVYDEMQIPHIFAESGEDAAFVQGYVTAKDRLWQMEFQTFVAAGRLSEVIGRGPEDKVLKLDLENRRKGLKWAAEKAVDEIEKDKKISAVMDAYTNGINAYIATLADADLPIEYKLLNYKPEKWETLKTALLLKYMANTLTSRSEDIENTNALKTFGPDVFKMLYPDRPFSQAPIIPEGTTFDYSNDLNSPESTEPKPKKVFKKKSFSNSANPVNLGVGDNNSSETPAKTYPEIDDRLHVALISQPEKHIGSNNWAVAGSKTASGAPILCNDPHLGLNLPSIWYEIQISYPGTNTYGASLPGAPGVISGFNDSIAWGVTNSERDVIDLFKIKYKDDKKEEYAVGSKWMKTDKKIEKFLVKGGEIVYDTVIYTHYGPIIYKNTEQGDLALRWTAHDPSNEALTFLKLNAANNYQDYVDAIKTYDCPGQNFVFASRSGDIAIWQQGKFPNKYKEQGMFILDGADSAASWKGFIPQSMNPHILNPERGYIGSTNQAPTDATYPFWYPGGYFENFRNRRMNQRLDSMKNIKIEDMQALQLDEYGVYAEDILPLLLRELDSAGGAKEDQKKSLSALRKWDYFYKKDAIAPSIFETWWYFLNHEIWDDEFDEHKLPMNYPDRAATIVLLRDSAHLKFYDNTKTKDKVETRRDIIAKSFTEAVDSMLRFRDEIEDWQWASVKQTQIQHITRILKPFGKYDLPVGGNASILNAIGKTWGPSWRMVVSLGKNEVEAYTIYPGGESGNPGSPHYDNFVQDWVEGKYHKAWFMLDAKDEKGKASRRVRIKG